MALCVWTAIHLNVPRKGKGSTRERILRKSGWALLGLLAPELVVYAAWKQRAAAQAVVKAVNDELRRILEPVTDSEDTEQTRKAEDDLQSFECRSWSLVHGFFAVMGGFVVKTKDRDQGPFVRGSPRLSLTGRGIVFLARYTDYVPDIEKDAILDRSKADRLAKGLACLQASWMIVQCTGRLVAQLPVTFLEINTLGHAICALLIYLFWIEKPLDVQDPWPIRDDIPRSVIAYMLMCSNGEWEYLKLYGEETLMRDTTANESTISSSYDSYYDSYYLGKSSDDSAHDGIKPSMLSVTQHRIRESTRWPKYQRILAHRTAKHDIRLMWIRMQSSDGTKRLSLSRNSHEYGDILENTPRGQVLKKKAWSVQEFGIGLEIVFLR
ncbi:hypothetical protein MMC20_006573 [Loxospora ochrophaea]|nr:hypothetical protein [Loxospora ochrophaea]